MSNPISVQGETRCDLCKGVLFPCTDCVNFQKTIDRSKKDASKAVKVKVLSEFDCDKAKQEVFQSLIRKRFNVKRIAKDGNCLFNSFIAAQKLHNDEQLTLKKVRDSLAAHLINEIEEKGVISGQCYDFFEKNDEGTFVLSGAFESLRGEKATRIKKGKEPVPQPTLHEYANMIKTGLYGGDLEMTLLASLYNVTFHIYSWHFFDGQHTYAPQVIGSGPHVVSLSYEQDFSSATGGKDHYNLLTSQTFSKWNAFMSAMPKWKVDFGPTFGKAGRGLVALRDFKKGEVLLYYDGHRVDENGEIVIERQAVKELYDHFSNEMLVYYDPVSFVRSHAVCLGRTHVTGLLIDGYPLTLPCFDDVEVLGRGALANSGSPRDSNMRMVWIEAPDLPTDFVDHLRDCEAFLVARRDIRFVDFVVHQVVAM
jgi:hypothetical protein